LYGPINWKVESNHFFQDANFCANQLATHKVDYEELYFYKKPTNFVV